MKINFKDVGRHNKSWSVETEKQPDYDFLYSQVRSRGGIMSDDIEFFYTEDTGEIKIMVGGFRKVGTAQIIK